MRWHSLQSGDRFWELSESACHVSEVLGDDPLISSSYASFIGDALGIHDSTQVANVAATSVPCQDAEGLQPLERRFCCPWMLMLYTRY